MFRRKYLLLAAIMQFGPLQAAELSQLSWLSGCWQREEARFADSREHWMPPAAGIMLGMSRTVLNGKLREFEAIRIEQAGDSLHYLAQPQGRPATTFKLSKLEETLVEFSNPDHDFPQLIRYRRSGDQLLAEIAGPASSGQKTLSFPMRKVACV